jgi:hypothetical protein
MQVSSRGIRLLTGYLLIAFLVVQSISGFLHVDLHSASHEPDVEHHHYPVLTTLDSSHTSAHASHDLVQLDLQLDGSLASKLSTPIFTLLFSFLLLLPLRTGTRIRTTTTSTPVISRIQHQSPPLRAPPCLLS